MNPSTSGVFGRRRSSVGQPKRPALAVDASLHGPGITGPSSSCPYLCPYSSVRAMTAKKAGGQTPKLQQGQRTPSTIKLSDLASKSSGVAGPGRRFTLDESTSSEGPSRAPSGLSTMVSSASNRLLSGLGISRSGSQLSMGPGLGNNNSSSYVAAPAGSPRSASASAAAGRPPLPTQASMSAAISGATNPALGTQSEDDVILTIGELRMFRRSGLREVLYWALGLLTGGLLLLLCKWLPELHVWLRFVELADKADPDADLAMVTSLDGVLSLCPLLALDPDTLQWLPADRLRARLLGGEPIVRRFDWRYERFWCEPATSPTATAPGVWTRRAFDLRGRPYAELHRIAAERVAEGILDPEGQALKVRAATYGPNMTDIAVPPYYMMVVHELLKPFFIFQVFSLAVWTAQQYYVYMYSILGMTAYSVLANAFGEWRNLRALQTLARSESAVDRVSLDPSAGGRAGGLVTEAVPSSALHPGDLIRIIPNMTLPCDVVLVTGHAILSEAMLTGEAAPVMKASLPPGDVTLFRPASERDKKFLLFSGTKVLQARCGRLPRLPSAQAPPLQEARYLWEAVVEPAADDDDTYAYHAPRRSNSNSNSQSRGPGQQQQQQQHQQLQLPVRVHHYHRPICVGMVMRTGFSTARGQLVRAILFPPPPKFDFEAQGYRFIWVLCSALVVGIIVQCTIYALHHEQVLPTIKDLLNLVTIAIPPALPLSLSIGLQISFARLKLKGVFCSHTRSVAAAGRVNCLCFDKTGTLTEDGLTLTGVQVVQQPPSQQQQANDTGVELGPALEDPAHVYIHHVQQQKQRQQQRSSSTTVESLYAPAVLVSLVMAACHSVSTLEEEDEALNRSTASLTLSAVRPVLEGMHQAVEEHTPNKKATGLLSSLPLLGDMVRSPSVSLSASQQSLADNVDGSSGGIALIRTHSLRSTDSASSGGTPHRLRLQRSLSAGGGGPKGAAAAAAAAAAGNASSNDVQIFSPVIEHVQSAPAATALFTASASSTSASTATPPAAGGAAAAARERRASFGSASDMEGPTTTTSLPTAPQHQHRLVGDSLEVQLFVSSGWRFCTRPADDHGHKRLPPPPDAALQMAGAFDETGVWAHPDLPPGTDTVILPPAAVAGEAGAVALAVVRRLDFDADLRRMGVIVQVLLHTPSTSSDAAAGGASSKRPSGGSKGPLLLLVKGAPEAMKELCVPSTLPHNLGAELQSLTCAGLRVLGCAWRHVTPAEVGGRREALEKGLNFLGLMTMENRLKPETVPYLSLFRAAAFRILMITGDNPATAAAVGRMAGAFCTPAPHAPALVLDGDGSAERPLRVADMEAPLVSLSLHDYLARFFPDAAHVTVRLPPLFGCTATAAASSGQQQQQLVRLKGPHDLVVTGRAFEALQRAHEDSMEAMAMGAGQQQLAGGWTALEVVIAKASIFARMSPQHKQDLVRALQDTGLVVCMTGDGANDSGALKAGDIGISIAAKAAPTEQQQAQQHQLTPQDVEASKAEAAVLAAPSIAAPFATGIHHIGAVSIILAEGRCALTTSVTMFKYMFLYGIIQFVSVLILYALVLELTAEQYLWADMGVVLGLVVLVPTMGPKAFLQRGRPETNLVSPTILRSIVGQTVIVVVFQILQQLMLAAEPWYERSVIDKSHVTANTIPPTHEATSKFLFANYQYICSCLAFCQTYGLFRQPVHRTPLLASYMTLELVIATVFCLAELPGLRSAFTLTDLPVEYRAKIFLLACAYTAAALFYERFCVPHVSDDEEPVPPEMVAPIPQQRRKSEAEEQEEQADAVAYASLSLEELERAERERTLCGCWDQQPTLLPKLRRGPPFYHQLRLAWTEAESRLQRASMSS